MRRKLLGRVKKISIVMGAIFCQVARIAQRSQFRLDMTDGSQKWQGGRPAFTIKASIRLIKLRLEKRGWSYKIIVENRRRRPEAMA